MQCYLSCFFALVFVEDTISLWTPNLPDFIATSIGPADSGVYLMHDHRCPLNPLGTYPYVVKFYADTNDAHLYIKTGVILSHTAVLTTCRGFHVYSLSQITINAQRIFRKKSTESQFCYQTRRPTAKIPHPKCVTDPSKDHSIDKFWDFQIFRLASMFEAEQEFVYPTVQIPKQPFDLMQFIRKVGIQHWGVAGCELPYFIAWQAPWGVLSPKANAEPLMKRDCITDICAIRENRRHCTSTLETYMNYTFICVLPDFIYKFDKDESIHPYLGAPLVCNNTGIGLSTENIIRRSQNRDLFLVATFLRAWPWLMQMKHLFWENSLNRAPWDSPFLESHPWVERKYVTRSHNKKISKDFVRFSFITRPPEKIETSGVIRLQILVIHIIHAIFTSIIFV